MFTVVSRAGLSSPCREAFIISDMERDEKQQEVLSEEVNCFSWKSLTYELDFSGVWHKVRFFFWTLCSRGNNVVVVNIQLHPMGATASVECDRCDDVDGNLVFLFADCRLLVHHFYHCTIEKP